MTTTAPITPAQARKQVVSHFEGIGLKHNKQFNVTAKRNPVEGALVVEFFGDNVMPQDAIIRELGNLPVAVKDTDTEVAFWRDTPDVIFETFYLDIAPPAEPPTPPAPISDEPQPRMVRYGQRLYEVVDTCVGQNHRYYAINILEYKGDAARLWVRGEAVPAPMHATPLTVETEPAPVPTPSELDTETYPAVVVQQKPDAVCMTMPPPMYKKPLIIEPEKLHPAAVDLMAVTLHAAIDAIQAGDLTELDTLFCEYQQDLFNMAGSNKTLRARYGVAIKAALFYQEAEQTVKSKKAANVIDCDAVALPLFQIEEVK